MEKFVKERDCDVKGCTSKASDTIASPANDCYTENCIVFLSYYDFMYGEDPEVTLIMKDSVYAKYYDN